MIRLDDPAGEWASMRGIRPRVYVCRRAPAPIEAGGSPSDDAWSVAPWTDDFVDIEGLRKPNPRFRTRAKMLWDDRCLYVAADMNEPHVVATLKDKNSVIYNDNDFEIFIDPDGDHHNYYEFEMNAHNTIWELSLPWPYKDGGDPKLGTNIDGLRSSVSIRGTINDPGDTDDGWRIDVAIPWQGLRPYHARRAAPPSVGDVWRINFSRVEWKYDVIDGKYVRHARDRSPEDNWVWSPQGIVDMHRPERWGFVLFSDRETELTPAQSAAIDSELAARDALMEVYHRQRSHQRAHGRFATTLAELRIDSACLSMSSRDGGGFVARTTVSSGAAGNTAARALCVREDSLLWEER